MKHPCLTLIASLALVGASLSAATPAHAGPKTACADAAERGQALRNEAKLRKALEELLVCARPTCPPIVSNDCTKWLADVQERLPTIVVHARDSRGRDVVGVRVLVDGAPLLERLDGVAVPVDPGTHVFRFEARSGAAVEVKLAIVEGEKRRLVPVTFDAALEVDGAPAAPSARTQSVSPQPVAHDAPDRAPVYIAGAIGLAALASFTYFELRGQSDYREMRDGCRLTRSCAQADVDAARRELIVALVSLGVAAASAGVVTWLLLRDDAPRVTAVNGGGLVELRGHF